MVTVAITREGVKLPPRPGRWPLPLDLAGLRLLELVALDPATPIDAVVHRISGELPPPARPLTDLVGSLGDAGVLAALEEGTAGPSPARRRTAGPAGPPVPRGRLLLADAPRLLRLVVGGFEAVDHDGRGTAVLGAAELSTLTEFLTPTSVDAAHAEHERRSGSLVLDPHALDALVGRLCDVGLLHTHDDLDPRVELDRGPAHVFAERQAQATDELRRRVAASTRTDPTPAGGAGAGGRPRATVVGVNHQADRPPLALGLLVAYAKAHEGGRLEHRYRFHPSWFADDDHLVELAAAPTVYLFSNYLWTHGANLATSARVKAARPSCITVHGGPSTPKYEADVAEYLDRYPHVDVVVRGEGERTTAELLDALADEVHAPHPDLGVLSQVAGLSFRGPDGVVRTADRPRIAELDAIPSPYLTGLFDVFAGLPGLNATIETNRGCPYGCTFCDWGSATLSRIRSFDLDRVLAEIEWCARNGVVSVGCADANFGIHARDVDIAHRVAELRAEHGLPFVFGVNFAKNTVRHLRPIVEVLSDAGVHIKPQLALQTMDAATLESIDRSNIRLTAYDELATAFREARLPFFVELMLGLPGQTPDSYACDLQECIDREVAVDLPITQMLVNSPMNEPSYKERHAIRLSSSPVGPGMAGVIATSSFTEDDYRSMIRLRTHYLLVEDFGVLRQVARYVRAETGRREIDFHRQLLDDVSGGDASWPYLRLTVEVVPWAMAPPISWRAMLDELREYLVTRVGVRDDPALTTVLSVQHALLPARDRCFPETLTLPHDYAAWFDLVLRAKAGPDRDRWPEEVPPLRELAPGTFTVDDPDGLVGHTAVGLPLDAHLFGLQWELRSPVARVDVSDLPRWSDFVEA